MKLPSLLSFAIPCLFLVACGGDGNLPPDDIPPSGSGKLIAEVHFPDPLLERCVDKAGKLWVSELIDLRCVPDEDRTVRDATGINELIALRSLDLSGSELTELDLSANTALTHLTFSAAQLTELDLTANKALTNIEIFNTALHELDLSENTLLKYLDIRQTPLTLINLSKNKALIYLDLVLTSLSSIDLSENTNLKGVNLSKNHFTEVDISANSRITDLNLAVNQLTSFNVPAANSLRNINLKLNAVSDINLSEATALAVLDISNNRLNELDLSLNHMLTQVDASSNQLSTINLAGATALAVLDISKNRLTKLDLSLHHALTQVDAASNQLSTIDLAVGGQLAALDVQANPLLTCLYLRNIRIQFPLLNLEFSGNCPLNGSSSSSSSSSSTSSSTSSSSSSSSGGMRKLIGDIHFLDPVLKACVLENASVYVDRLRNLQCSDVADSTGLEQLVALEHLDLNRTKIQSIDLTAMPNLRYLNLNDIAVTELDLSKNTELTNLELRSVFQLRSLDLSANLKLQQVYILRHSPDNFSCTSMDAILLQFPEALFNNYDCREDASSSSSSTSSSTSSSSSSTSSSSSSSSTSSSTSSSSGSSGGMRKLISDIHFPDPALASCVLQTTMAFVDQLVELRCKGVVDTTGLEQLVALKKLNLDSTKITSIDLTGMPQLNELVIYQMNLTELDLSKNTELRILELTHFYYLNGLDLSANLKITNIQLRGYSPSKFSCSSYYAIFNRFPRAFIGSESECRTDA
jgi:trimeric autotransporter adhesin